MSTILLQGGRLLDPASGRDEVGDLSIVDGRIAAVGGTLSAPERVLDCRGKLVTPGLIELHCGWRDPGFEEDETTASATAAALAGGFTLVGACPDTRPVVDNRAAAEYVVLQAERAGHCRVFPLGAVTRDNGGQELADIGQLIDAGALAFTDGKRPIQSAEILRRALEYARMFERPIFTHPQDATLTAGGVMHEGYHSTLLGLRGMPAAAEEIMVGRDIALVELTRGRIHLMCLSTRNAVERVRQAKRGGLAVTADVAIHNLLLTDAALRTYSAHCKVDPPFRTAADISALIAGLKDGTIEALSSDHQPSAAEKKDREIDQVPFGIVGLETLLPLAIEALIEPGHLTWLELIATLTTGPARILGLADRGRLTPGSLGDVTVIDPDTPWTINPTTFRSQSRNTPFAGRAVRGRATQVLIGGEVRYAWSPA